MSTDIPQTHITKPETFILESLNTDDEEKGRFEGKILYDILKLQGKNPIYYYFRTQIELVKFSEIFRKSGYRYLHLSCHGNTEALEFTFTKCDYNTFADIFERKLNNRRLFISGCSLGNKQLAEKTFIKSGGMYSLTAPIREVFFDQTTSFWPAFYYMMHAWDSSNMKKHRLQYVLNHLTSVFEISLAHYFKNTALGGVVDEQIFLSDEVSNTTVPAKEGLLPGEPSE